jgi:hypothetical protein
MPSTPRISAAYRRSTTSGFWRDAQERSLIAPSSATVYPVRGGRLPGVRCDLVDAAHFREGLLREPWVPPEQFMVTKATAAGSTYTKVTPQRLTAWRAGE